MEVRPGYKRTEVGIIPEDWDVHELSSLIKAGPKNGYSGRSAKEARGTATLSLGATTSGHLLLNDDTVKRLEETIEPTSELFLQRGDVLVQRSNTLDLVGTVALFDGPSGVYVYPDLMMRIRFREPETASWFWRYANSARGRRFFVSVAAGSSGSMPKISGEKLRGMRLPIPPLPEQRAITETLSDVDALLERLTQLIAKKRDLKQAAIQQLLTGQTRLPGFHGEWEVSRLGRAGACLRGVTYSADSDLSAYDTDRTKRLLRSNNVDNAVVVTSAVQFVNSARVSPSQVLRKDDILICMANGSKALVGKAGRFSVTDGYDYTFGAFMGCFRTDANTANPQFVFWLLQTGKYRDYIHNLLAGSSINNLRPSSIESLEFSFPAPAEQTAIATVLSDMDAELSALEARREKTRALKQAMMQELLTGRTRLV
jgi:type I restriction enzyme S subunit